MRLRKRPPKHAQAMTHGCLYLHPRKPFKAVPLLLQPSLHPAAPAPSRSVCCCLRTSNSAWRPMPLVQASSIWLSAGHSTAAQAAAAQHMTRQPAPSRRAAGVSAPPAGAGEANTTQHGWCGLPAQGPRCWQCSAVDNCAGVCNQCPCCCCCPPASLGIRRPSATVLTALM